MFWLYYSIEKKIYKTFYKKEVYKYFLLLFPFYLLVLFTGYFDEGLTTKHSTTTCRISTILALIDSPHQAKQ